MTEFGAVRYPTLETFHGTLWDSTKDPDNPAIPIAHGTGYDPIPIMQAFHDWLKLSGEGRPIFVSDNPAYDWQWINYHFHHALGTNPFGHSARRIGDYYAGLTGDWKKQSQWKSLRQTRHSHHPVDDALGNAEAFAAIQAGARP